MKNRLRPWELALSAALVITFSIGFWADRTQSSLSDRLIRLHVIAASDSEEDQAAKLVMRDRVLELLTPRLTECETREQAASVIRQSIPALEALGDVTVTFDTEYYPTRHYDGFSLPAGEYLSLRVVMAEGRGHNWWCVVFPPLCAELLSEQTEDAFLSLDESQTALITQSDGAYEIKFRVVSLWSELKDWYYTRGMNGISGCSGSSAASEALPE